MRAGLLIIGSEILSGRTPDKNIEALATALRGKGMLIGKVVVIKDDIATIVENMRALMQEFQWTFCSGGMGPTRDDMTKQALCQLAGVPLEENQQAEKLALLHYQRYGRTWTRETNAYNLIPRGVIPLENPAGLAPGLFFTGKAPYLWLNSIPLFLKQRSTISPFEPMEFRRRKFFSNFVPSCGTTWKSSAR